MALTRLNYQQRQYEACTDETLLPSSPVLNTWYNFEIGNWKHAISDIVLKQGGSPIPETAYELAIDTKYTARESSGSGKTIYAKWRIIDGTYATIATTVSGNNFGSYIDNEKLEYRLPHVITSTIQNIAGTVNYDFTVDFDKVIFYSVSVVNSNGRFITIPVYGGDVSGPDFAALLDNSGSARIAINWAACDIGVDGNLANGNTVIVTVICKP